MGALIGRLRADRAIRASVSALWGLAFAVAARVRLLWTAPARPVAALTDLSAEIDELAKALRPMMPTTADSLVALGQVVSPATDEIPVVENAQSMQWSSVDLFRAFDPEVLGAAVGRLSTERSQRRLGLIDAARAMLIFVPVTITWIGIGKATAVFSTCSAEAGQFLRLWQQGFPEENGCQPSAGMTFGLPLNSLEQVVFADTLVLTLLMVLTFLSQRAAVTIDSARVGDSTAFADRLRTALSTCSRRLHPPQSEEAIGSLVVQASQRLEEVAKHFSAQTDLMMQNLQERSGETERSLVALERSYEKVAETTVQATDGLKEVVERVALTADRLVETSMGVRDELAAGTAALRDSVANSSARLDQLGKQLADAMSITASQLTETTKAVREDLVDGAAALRESVRTSSDQLRDFGGQLRAVGDGLQNVDGQFSQLARLGTEAESKNESARENIARMANSMAGLGDLDKSIQELYLSERRVLAPVPAWQTYGVVLVVQTILILVLVLRVGDPNASFGATEATPVPAPEPTQPTEVEYPPTDPFSDLREGPR